MLLLNLFSRFQNENIALTQEYCDFLGSLLKELSIILCYFPDLIQQSIEFLRTSIKDLLPKMLSMEKPWYFLSGILSVLTTILIFTQTSFDVNLFELTFSFLKSNNFQVPETFREEYKEFDNQMKRILEANNDG